MKKGQNEKNPNCLLKSNEMRNKSKNLSKWGTLGSGSQNDALKLSMISIVLSSTLRSKFTHTTYKHVAQATAANVILPLVFDASSGAQARASLTRASLAQRRRPLSLSHPKSRPQSSERPMRTRGFRCISVRWHALRVMASNHVGEEPRMRFEGKDKNK